MKTAEKLIQIAKGDERKLLFLINSIIESIETDLIEIDALPKYTLMIDQLRNGQDLTQTYESIKIPVNCYSEINAIATKFAYEIIEYMDADVFNEQACITTFDVLEHEMNSFYAQ